MPRYQKGEVGRSDEVDAVMCDHITHGFPAVDQIDSGEPGDDDRGEFDSANVNVGFLGNIADVEEELEREIPISWVGSPWISGEHSIGLLSGQSGFQELDPSGDKKNDARFEQETLALLGQCPHRG